MGAPLKGHSIARGAYPYKAHRISHAHHGPRALRRVVNTTTSSVTTSSTGKYLVPSLQIRWAYFQLGWEMREVTK